ncbi:MAG: IS66 family transposase [Acidobacteriota bacterium]|nr:IS66 family transposase [Acidobacteriota bacterium]
MPEHDQPDSTNPSEIEALIARLEDGQLRIEDQRLIGRLLRLLLTLISVVEQKNTSISRLKRLLFGPGSDKRTAVAAAAPSNTSSKDAPPAADESSELTTPSESQIAEPTPRRGHGRRAAADYTGARLVACADPKLMPGDGCPQSQCRGHLYDTKAPAVLIRLEGRPIISATQYEQQVLRCSACAERFTAPLPEGVPAQKYDPTADVAIALYKYGAAMPFYRQARLQEMCGVPVPESVQYERCALVAECVRPVYEELARMAARADVIHSDDTRVVILDLLKENKGLPAGARRGVQTTGIVARTGQQQQQQQIALYVSGRRHAGENIAQLLEKRAPEMAPPIQMSDALAANWTGEFERIVAKCLAHARRQFVDIEPAFPRECARVLDSIGAVYGFDAQTRAMSDEQRLLFHQQQSAAVLAGLRQWLDEQIRERMVEPNSSLGGAFAYLLKHWDGLTKFLTVAGAPLDNNLCERALKLAVLHRKNALFYKTQRGASTGDCLMSLIKTCALNHMNAWEYLLALVRNERLVGRDPAQWLPWNYRAAAPPFERREQAA